MPIWQLVSAGAAGFSRQTVVRAFSEAYETNWIPLTWISYHFDHALFGLDPAGYHLVNAALHTISAVLLYFALFAMTRALGPSAFVAAVFAVHPLHVESVAWAAERKDTLSGVFWMLTLLAYARYAARPSLTALLTVLLAFALGLLAKPMLVSLPLVLLLLDYWPLRRLGTDDSGGIGWRRLRDCIAEKLPLFAIAAVVAWITIVVQDDAGAMASDAQIPLSLRISNALVTCWIYIADSICRHGPGRGDWALHFDRTHSSLLDRRMAVVPRHPRSRNRLDPGRHAGASRSLPLPPSNRPHARPCLGRAKRVRTHAKCSIRAGRCKQRRSPGTHRRRMATDVTLAGYCDVVRARPRGHEREFPGTPRDCIPISRLRRPGNRRDPLRTCSR
ncbi:MAG: glycosyltransferase family 39 protein, partial [Deltaproteobacteria bacterium]|nr:glycosyltransferase family 39 protein [Deltaproteobacteria bacterium]